MIALDVSAVTAFRTGVGTYAEHLARSLSALDVPLVLLTNRPEELPPDLAAMNLARSPRRPKRPTIAWLQLAAPRAALRSGAEIAHFTTGRAPAIGGPPFVLTVHDLVALEHPEHLRARERLLVAPWLARSITQAASIIAVSRDTAASIARVFPELRTPVHVVPQGVDPIWFEPPPVDVERALAARFGLGPRVWVHVGAHGRRKNVPRLCEAYAIALAHVGGDGPQLVLAGPGGEDDAAIGRAIARHGLVYGRDGDVILTGYLRAKELRALVARAEFCVQPSLHEGFGLPVVEAMAAGTPCITSGRGALREFGDEAKLIADPTSALAIATAMLDLAGDVALRSRLSRTGRVKARELTWTRCAEATAMVYKEVRSRPSKRAR